MGRLMRRRADAAGRSGPRRRAATSGVALVVGLLLVASSCGSPTTERSPTVSFGDPDVGRRLVADYGCGACHRIPDVPGAEGLVGPPLDAMGRRTFIAGHLPNRPDQMVRWLLDPPAVEPGTAMPDLGLSRAQARDIAAFLAGLR